MPPTRTGLSCRTCRSRKVRCDREIPCSHCRRAGIECVQPERQPPKWARRLQSSGHVVDNVTQPPAGNQMLDKILALESLVEDLRGHLSEQNESLHTHVSPSQPQMETPASSAGSTTGSGGMLVADKRSGARYIDAGFWTRIQEELDGLKTTAAMDGGDRSDTEDTIPANGSGASPVPAALDRPPIDTILFGGPLRDWTTALKGCQPLASQIPFLYDIFCDNVNTWLRIVHEPTFKSTIRQMRSQGLENAAPGLRALMFSIFYAAVNSMRSKEILQSFGGPQNELSERFRLGMDLSLREAEFIKKPDFDTMKAYGIFLCLAKLHESPRYIWMMTGLFIRMAHFLGLHRDGSHFAQLTPFEIEMRRRLWGLVCLLDLRAAEDQGMPASVLNSQYDTAIPMNIDDADLTETMLTPLQERQGMSDTSLLRIALEQGRLARMLSSASADGESLPFEEQAQLLEDFFPRLYQTYAPYTPLDDNAGYEMTVTVTHLVAAKMLLLTCLTSILSSDAPSLVTESRRHKLLISAIEVAEYSHAIHSDMRFRPFDWICKTYTHWYAIIFILIEMTRLPWSPMIERAWIALHSEHVLPDPSSVTIDSHLWSPLRRMLTRVRRRRETETSRLRADPETASKLDLEDRNLTVPMSPPVSRDPTHRSRTELEIERAQGACRARWRKLVGLPGQLSSDVRTARATTKVSQATSVPEVASNGKFTSGTPQLYTGDNAATKLSGLLREDTAAEGPDWDMDMLDWMDGADLLPELWTDGGGDMRYPAGQPAFRNDHSVVSFGPQQSFSGDDTLGVPTDQTVETDWGGWLEEVVNMQRLD